MRRQKGKGAILDDISRIVVEVMTGGPSWKQICPFSLLPVTVSNTESNREHNGGADPVVGDVLSL